MVTSVARRAGVTESLQRRMVSAGIDTDGSITGTAAGLSRGDANGIGTRAVAEGETATRNSKWGFGTSGKVAINACGQF